MGIDEEFGSGSVGGCLILGINGFWIDEEEFGDEILVEKIGSGCGYVEGESDDGSF